MPLVWTPKSEPTPWNEHVLAMLSKAIGHPARVHLLRVLLAKGPSSASALVRSVGLAQSTVSQHLGMLRKADLIRFDSQGPSRLYRVNSPALRRLKNAVDALVEQIAPARVRKG